MRGLGVLIALSMAAVGADSAVSRGHATRDKPVVRSCQSSVWGDLGSDWTIGSIAVGPLRFVRARAYATSASSFAGIGGGRYRGSKLLVLVRTGWVVRVVVPVPHRGKVALQYDPQDFNEPVVPARGDHVVTFVACPPGRPFLGPKTERWTQFNGSIVVAGRRCVKLAVHAARRGQSLPKRAQLARLSFGAGRCEG